MSPRKQSVKRTASVKTTAPKRVKKAVEARATPEVDEARFVWRPGKLLVFGEGISGQLGLGEENVEKPRPVKVPDLPDLIDVVAGAMHTVCLTTDHKVITFGCNDEGALGRDTSEDGSEFTPHPVEGLDDKKVVQITAGDSHTAVLLDNGSVYIWGTFRDTHGSMGLRIPKAIEKRPTLVDLKVKVVKMASGSHHLVLLGRDRNLYTCGCGEQGQLGRVSERSASRDSRLGLAPLLTPTIVSFTKKLEFDDVWSGAYATFAKERSKGEVYVTGLNNYHQIGLDQEDIHFRPVISNSFSARNWAKIRGGDHHTIALDVEGGVFTIGRKEYGRLGLGKDSGDALTPTQVPVLAGIKCVDVSCNAGVSFAVTHEGKLYSWGMASSQLGLGPETDDILVPTEVKGRHLEGLSVMKVSTGGLHTLVLAAG